MLSEETFQRCHLGNLHAQTYLLPGPVRAMEALQNICEVGRQCLVRRQCVKVTMQMQNNAKIRTSGRRLMACDLSSTAACFCSGDLNRVGISSCASVGEHMRDAKITMQHTWHFLFLLLLTTWSGEWAPLQAFVKWAVSA